MSCSQDRAGRSQKSHMAHASRESRCELRMRAVDSSDAVSLEVVEVIIITMGSSIAVWLGGSYDGGCRCRMDRKIANFRGRGLSLRRLLWVG